MKNQQEQLYVFGTGNAVVTRCYNTCFAIKNTNGQFFMVDTGGGNTILRVLEDMEVSLSCLHHIFITHEHTDHLLGVVWMVRIIATQIKKGNYQNDLRIYCHEELVNTIQTICQLTLQDKFYQLIGDRIHLVPVRDGQTVRILDYDITFFNIHSTKAKQYGFRTTLSNDKNLFFAGDEPLHQNCFPLAANQDWLLHEAFCLYSQKERFQPYEKHHSTVKDACELAAQLHTKNLVLWHTEDRNLAERKELYRQEGAAYFSGQLYIPDDLDVIDL